MPKWYKSEQMSCEQPIAAVLRPNDSTRRNVEEIVHVRKRILGPPRTRRREKRFRPESAYELVLVTETGRELRLKVYRERGEYILELLAGQDILRKLHTHDNHYNPGGARVEGCHKHFPTRTCPLTRHTSSYAYPIDCGELNLHDLAALFFEEINAENADWQLPMDIMRTR